MLSSFGEVGSYLLEGLLIILFPNNVIGNGITAPLSTAHFRTFILLPEVAVRLIMQDLGQDREAAMATMQWSVSYGESQFPLRDRDEDMADLMLTQLRRSILPVRDVSADGN